MKKQARVFRLGLMVAVLTCLAISSVAMSNDAASEEEIERIPFALPALKADKMPPVFFSHDLHIAAMEDDCTPCHTASEEFFLDSEGQKADKVIAYVHKSCVSCHTKLGKGPLLASCRSCHNSAIADKQAKAAKK